MTAVDCWQKDGHSFVYCIGSDISTDFSCSAISNGATTYEVEAYEVNTALWGGVSAVLMLKRAENILLGEYRAVKTAPIH